MAVKTSSAANIESIQQASWLPMAIIALAQIQMCFNVSALPVSIGAIVEDFDTSPGPMQLVPATCEPVIWPSLMALERGSC